MFSLSQRLQAFSALGEFFLQAAEPESLPDELDESRKELLATFKNVLAGLQAQNGWFTPQEVNHALVQWGKALDKIQLNEWVNRYPRMQEDRSPVEVSLILAGNLPLVGFHDVLCVLLVGHHVVFKCAAEDQLLVPATLEVLTAIEPKFEGRWRKVDRLLSPQAVIATGSGNSARYFESYFSHIPSIIRKNRNAVAVLNGQETPEQMAGLAEDIFRYYGLGCRSVAHAMVPKGYDLNKIFQAIFPWQEVIQHNKYANNYDYYRALYLLNKDEVLENGFFLIKRDDRWGSPAAVLHYSEYENLEEVENTLAERDLDLQCVVTSCLSHPRAVNFGQTQSPRLWDYADGVDTVAFLLAL